MKRDMEQETKRRSRQAEDQLGTERVRYFKAVEYER